jgi:hypothetical protein
MEASEIADSISEAHEHHAGRRIGDDFRKLTGVYVGFVAMLLAIAALGGGNAVKEMLSANIHASDTYAFYQAKYMRQLSYQIAAEQLELQTSAGLPEAASNKAAEMIKHYRDTAARYESDPQAKNGKKELLDRAHEWEAKRDHAAAQNPNFEFAEALLQIAIVLGSVSIVASSRALLGVSGVLAICGLLLTINGYLLLAPFPHL